MTHASRNTTTGLLFEQHTKGEAIGIPLHKKELGKYYTEKTKKYYALSMVRPSKSNGLPADKEERAKRQKASIYFLVRQNQMKPILMKKIVF